MPRGDGTGPWGQGPMTGRAAGYCAGYDQPGAASPGPGRGYGRGQGRGLGPWGWGRGAGGGRGMRWGTPGGWVGPVGPAEPTPLPAVDEKTVLERQREGLRAQLEQLEARLKSLEGPAAPE